MDISKAPWVLVKYAVEVACQTEAGRFYPTSAAILAGMTTALGLSKEENDVLSEWAREIAVRSHGGKISTRYSLDEIFDGRQFRRQ